VCLSPLNRVCFLELSVGQRFFIVLIYRQTLDFLKRCVKPVNAGAEVQQSSQILDVFDSCFEGSVAVLGAGALVVGVTSLDRLKVATYKAREMRP